MSTCPNCLKKYKYLSRHLYSSSCIAIKSKSNPRRKFVQTKHKTFRMNIVPNRTYSPFVDDNCDINTKSTQNEMILLYEKINH